MFKSKKGFTLIELLIVVAIIGILAALLIPNALTAMQKAKQKATMKDIATISTALADYVTDNGRAPVQTGSIDATFQLTLSPFYIKVCPLNDQWGNPIYVNSGAVGTERGCDLTGVDDFVVISYGRDGTSDGVNYDPTAPEAAMYTVSSMADFAFDLIMFDGSWVRCPETRNAAATAPTT